MKLEHMIELDALYQEAQHYIHAGGMFDVCHAMAWLAEVSRVIKDTTGSSAQELHEQLEQWRAL